MAFEFKTFFSNCFNAAFVGVENFLHHRNSWNCRVFLNVFIKEFDGKFVYILVEVSNFNQIILLNQNNILLIRDGGIK